MRDICYEIANTAWVLTYADAVEYDEFDGPHAGAGEDWFDIAPHLSENHPMVDRVSETLRFVDLDGERDRWVKESGNSEDLYGYKAAMEAMGTGVGLSDDHPGRFTSLWTGHKGIRWIEHLSVEDFTNLSDLNGVSEVSWSDPTKGDKYEI